MEAQQNTLVERLDQIFEILKIRLTYAESVSTNPDDVDLRIADLPSQQEPTIDNLPSPQESTFSNTPPSNITLSNDSAKTLPAAEQDHSAEAIPFLPQLDTSEHSPISVCSEATNTHSPVELYNTPVIPSCDPEEAPQALPSPTTPVPETISTDLQTPTRTTDVHMQQTLDSPSAFYVYGTQVNIGSRRNPILLDRRKFDKATMLRTAQRFILYLMEQVFSPQEMAESNVFGRAMTYRGKDIRKKALDSIKLSAIFRQASIRFERSAEDISDDKVIRNAINSKCRGKKVLLG